MQASDIRQAALTDAEVFASEFPGERIAGDWGSEAWAIFTSAAGNDEAAYDEMVGEDGAAWHLYSRTLRAAVEREAQRHNARQG